MSEPYHQASGAEKRQAAAHQGREVVAGCVMPTDRQISAAESECRNNAKEGSRQLLQALIAYARRHHPGSALARMGIGGGRG